MRGVEWRVRTRSRYKRRDVCVYGAKEKGESVCEWVKKKVARHIEFRGAPCQPSGSRCTHVDIRVCVTSIFRDRDSERECARVSSGFARVS